MNKFIIFILLTVLVPSFVFAADPTISSDGGTPTHGSSYTIYGSNFGTTYGSHIGFLNDYIESGSDEVSVSGLPSGWTVANNGFPDIKFDNAYAYSGSFSLRSSNPEGSCYPGCSYSEQLRYNLGGSHDEVFLATWLRATVVTDDGASQWKAIRITPDGNVSDPVAGYFSTTAGEIYWGRWTDGNQHFTMFCEDNNQSNSDCYPGNVLTYWGYNLPAGGINIPYNTWFRVDMYARHNTSAGNEDGRVEFRVFRPGVSLQEMPTSDTWETRGEGVVSQFTNVYFQHLMGSGGADMEGHVWTDDPYIQTGSQARVEICAESTWAARTECEIQKPSSWANDEITVTFNQGGSFASSETVYVYVVNDDGDVNASGYSETVGTDSTPPTVSSATINGSAAVINCSETVVTTLLDNGDFVMTGSTTGASNLNSCSSDGNVISCTAADTFVNGESVTLAYSGGTDEVEDTSGNDMQTFSGTSVTNNTSAGDIEDPVLTITSHTKGETYQVGSYLVTITFTGTDDVAIDYPEVSCPSCANVGAITGSNPWSCELTLSISGLGSELIASDGTFASDGGWDYSGDVSISGGVVSFGGTNSLYELTPTSTSENITYRFEYDIVSTNSVTPYLSQWGFPGEGYSIPLSSVIGTDHYVDVVCHSENTGIMITPNGFAGTMDNFSLKQKGSDNIVTITLYDTSANTDSGQVTFAYASQNEIAVQVTEGSDITIPTGSDITWTLTPVE